VFLVRVTLFFLCFSAPTALLRFHSSFAFLRFYGEIDCAEARHNFELLEGSWKSDCVLLISAVIPYPIFGLVSWTLLMLVSVKQQGTCFWKTKLRPDIIE
jgi:hypothetical protein